ncbi:MAG: DUF6938 domain-containing protein [Candidatus Eisenbacteria bacterium]
MNQAWIVAVDMGYGHQRAAYPFRDVAFERIITANTDDCVSADESRRWEQLQGFYEGVSRAHNVPIVGPWIWRAYDALQAIQPHYPFRDLSRPSLGTMQFQRLIRRGLGRSVPEYTRKREDLPFLTTFYAVALAADHAGRPDVFCVVTDSDINRVWVADDPKKSRIHYLAPTPLSRVRLLQYGVPEERIFVTGFPLPTENVANAASDLARRLSALDAKGSFRAKYRDVLKPAIGEIPETTETPLSITFAVGGAGAQARQAHDILASLTPVLREGRVRLNLVAGVRSAVNDTFLEAIRALGLEPELGRSVHILFVPTKDEYFARFNDLMRVTDVLWTKPSELCVYGALGIPILMSPPLGAHEVRNQATLLRIGAGQKQEDPRHAIEWLTDWTHNGLLALNAFNGFFHMPCHGTENIKRVMFAPDRSKVELMTGPPARAGAPSA